VHVVVGSRFFFLFPGRSWKAFPLLCPGARIFLRRVRAFFFPSPWIAGAGHQIRPPFCSPVSPLTVFSRTLLGKPAGVLLGAADPFFFSKLREPFFASCRHSARWRGVVAFSKTAKAVVGGGRSLSFQRRPPPNMLEGCFFFFFGEVYGGSYRTRGKLADAFSGLRSAVAFGWQQFFFVPPAKASPAGRDQTICLHRRRFFPHFFPFFSCASAIGRSPLKCHYDGVLGRWRLVFFPRQGQSPPPPKFGVLPDDYRAPRVIRLLALRAVLLLFAGGGLFSFSLPRRNFSFSRR